jgi:hypothetical protein
MNKQEIHKAIQFAREQGFQKGKLEAEIECKNILDNLDYGLLLEEQNVIVLRIRNKIKEFKKQLQKEIGGVKTSEEKQDE